MPDVPETSDPLPADDAGYDRLLAESLELMGRKHAEAKDPRDMEIARLRAALTRIAEGGAPAEFEAIAREALQLPTPGQAASPETSEPEPAPPTPAETQNAMNILFNMAPVDAGPTTVAFVDPQGRKWAAKIDKRTGGIAGNGLQGWQSFPKWPNARS